MRKLLLLLGTALMLSFAGCESFGGDDVVGGSYSIGGAIQKGPFVQGSTITIQPLNSKLKPIGQMYTTQTTNDAGMFEMDGVNSKYAEIIATGYYFDEVEGKISASPLTLRSIADLKDGAQTNVNILTSLTYNRIKILVTNEGKDIAEAQKQAEKELFTALNIPPHLRPSVSCGAMNIANNGEGDGLLLALSAILQEGRSVGELTEYISKFATDLADDGKVNQTLLEKFNLDGQHLLRFEDRIKDNLKARYEDLGVECNIPEFSQYLSHLGKPSECFIIPFTYYENINDPDVEYEGIEQLKFRADVDYLGYDYYGGFGEIYLSAAPTVIHTCQCDVLRTIDIPNGVTCIPAYAFMGCKSLENITIPDSVTWIGQAAFYGCSSLTSLKIPDSVTEIGDNAFYYCHNLESVNIPDGVAYIKDNTFEGCWKLADIIIPNSVTYIGDCAFYNCVGLVNIDIPDSVTHIGEWAFGLCYNLACINIPDSVTWIGGCAFTSCPITSITIGGGVTYIGDGAFTDCGNLAVFKGDLASKDGRCLILNNKLVAFAPSGLTEYIIPDGVTEICGSTFWQCLNLESVTIPQGVTYIGRSAFENCRNLKSVNIPEEVVMIDDAAFCYCSKLTNITIPEGVEYIGMLAFWGVHISEITLPSTLAVLKWKAFGSRHALNVYCKPTTPPNTTFVEGVWCGFFSDVDQITIYVPEDSVYAYQTTEGWSEYADDIVGYDFDK